MCTAGREVPAVHNSTGGSGHQAQRDRPGRAKLQLSHAAGSLGGRALPRPLLTQSLVGRSFPRDALLTFGGETEHGVAEDDLALADESAEQFVDLVVARRVESEERRDVDGACLQARPGDALGLDDLPNRSAVDLTLGRSHASILPVETSGHSGIFIYYTCCLSKSRRFDGIISSND